MNIPNNLVGDKELKSLFLQMGGSFETGIQYKEILEQVYESYKNFSDIPDLNQGMIFKNRKTKPSSEITERFDIINTSEAPINSVEQIGQRARFVRKHLRDTIKNNYEFHTRLKPYEKKGCIS